MVKAELTGTRRGGAAVVENCWRIALFQVGLWHGFISLFVWRAHFVRFMEAGQFYTIKRVQS